MDKLASVPVLDCYVRLSEAVLLLTPLRQLHSEVDSDNEYESAARAFAGASATSSIRGYTEWISDLTPGVSVGWDWLVAASGELTMDPNSVRTNVMLVDEQDRDLGIEATIEAIVRYINRHPWQEAALDALHGSGATGRPLARQSG